MPTIALDAMGGDHAPDEIVKGAALVSTSTDIETLLVGDVARLQVILDHVPYNPEHLSLVPARTVIGMSDDPREALRTKKDASLVVAIRAAVDGRADAVVSAGNTGACVLGAAEYFALLPGIRRAALASVYPRQTEHEGQDRMALILDVGATVRCEADELVQFALMGGAYARRISKVAEPRIGLLNMGEEESKGGPVLVETHRRLRHQAGLNFVGNVEGHDLVHGKADVIVCEGLLGNVTLKLLEGISGALDDLARGAAEQRFVWRVGLRLLSQGIERVHALTDYTQYGGSPILGFDRLLIKCHGRSNAHAIANAVKVAAKAVRDRVPDEIRDALLWLR